MPRDNGGAGLSRTFRTPWGLQHDYCKLAQPRLQRALGVDHSARPVVLWCMRVHGGFAFGLSETATRGIRCTALTMEAPRDLQRVAGQDLGSEHAAPHSCMGEGSGTSKLSSKACSLWWF